MMDKLDSLYIQKPLRKKLYTSKTGYGNNLDLAAGLISDQGDQL